MVDVNAFTLFGVSQDLNTFYGEGIPGREEVHRLKAQGLSRFLISLENLALCYLASCQDPLSGTLWSRVLGQEPGQEQIQMLIILNYENFQGSFI